MHSPIASASWEKKAVTENGDRKLPKRICPLVGHESGLSLSMQLALFFISDMIVKECCACVEDTLEYIRADDLFQLVASQGFCVKLMVRGNHQSVPCKPVALGVDSRGRQIVERRSCCS